MTHTNTCSLFTHIDLGIWATDTSPCLILANDLSLPVAKGLIIILLCLVIRLMVSMEMNLLAIDLQYSPQPPQAKLLAACAH